MADVPVAFIVFRRPDHTRRVFERIAQAKPKKLFVIADGADPSRAGEAEKCASVRKIIEGVDWPCEVVRNFSEENMGPRERISSGLNWVFSQCESAIVLEDDELPEPSFFPYCRELLERYRDDTRVMAINGLNLQFGRRVTPDSYYLSRYFHCWGFASWARAWKSYDVAMSRWAQLRDTPWLVDVCAGNQREADYHSRMFDKVASGEIQTWDYQVTFAVWANSGLCITPEANLISNIGYGEEGFYCRDENSPLANMQTEPMQFPLRHPELVLRNFAADRQEYESNIVPALPESPTLYRRMRRAVKKMVMGK